MMLPLLALLAVTAGCVGGRGYVRTDRTTVPISFTAAIPDAAGRSLLVGKDLQPVGEFRHDATSVGFVYMATPMSIDISDAVNAQVQAVRGEGVANFGMTVRGCGLNYVFPLNHLPLWPGCARVSFRGVIVRRVSR